MKNFIIFLLVWSSVSDFFVTKLPVLGFLDEVIVSVLFLHLLIDAIIHAGTEKRKIFFYTLDILILVFIGWSVGSFIINASYIPQLFKFLFSVCKGFIIFYWCRKFIAGHELVQQITSILKWLIIIQLPFFMIGLLLKGSGYFGDNAVGAIITGDASAVGTYFWLGIIICIALFDRDKEKRYLVYILILLVLLIVTSTKQLTILLPLVLLFLYGRRLSLKNLKQIFFVAFAITAGVLLYNQVEKKWMMNYGVDASESSLVNYFDESEKFLGYYSLLYELPGEISHPLAWGAGPGMYGSYVAMNARTPLSQKYIMYYYDLIPDGLGGTLAYRSSSVIGFWGDIGLVGLLVIMFIYGYQTFGLSKKLRTASPVLYHLIIASGMLLLAQSFILNVFEGNSFSLNLFWVLGGVAAAQLKNSEQNNPEEVCA